MQITRLIQNRPHSTALAAAILALLAGGIGGQSSALAGGPPLLPPQFSGLINDYTPMTVDGLSTGATIKGAPYEMHGIWTLNLNIQRSRASFAAEMTMQTSEVANTSSVLNPEMLGAHVHHVSMTDGVVTTNWQANCPTLKPAATAGFAVTGTLYVTANGSNPPFGNPSPATICILGGTSTGMMGTASVPFSNLTLTIGAPADAHFSSLPIHGVVTQCDARLGYGISPNCNVLVK